MFRVPRSTTLVHPVTVKVVQSYPGANKVFYSTAIRRQELVDLVLPDLDLEGRAIRIECGKGGKGRMVPIGKAAIFWLGRYLASARPSLLGRRDDPGRVFLTKSGRPMAGQEAKEVVRPWARAAGVAKNVTPHALRRSCATGMIRNRANPGHVKDLLGQDDYRSLNSYIKLEVVDLKDAHRRFHPREREGDDSDSPDSAAPPIPGKP